MVFTLPACPKNYGISLVEGESYFFDPPRASKSYTERGLAESERSEAEQGEARYKILEQVRVKKVTFNRDRTDRDPIVSWTCW